MKGLQLANISNIIKNATLFANNFNFLFSDC